MIRQWFSPVWMRVRADVRTRWRSMLVLALLIGIGGGVALTALDGARRTDRAVAQFQAYSRPDDGGFTYGSVLSPTVPPGSGTSLTPVEKQVVGLPQVAAWFRLPEVDLTTDPTGKSTSALDVLASPDPDFMRRVDRPLMVTGRLPAVDQPFEAAINPLAAQELHLRVGSTLRLFAYSAGQIQSLSSPSSGGGPFRTAFTGVAPSGPAITVRIVGIFRLPSDVNAVEPYAARADVSYEGQQELYLPPSFLPRLASMLQMPVGRFPFLNLVSVRLRDRTADFAAFSAGAERVGAGKVFVGDPGNVLGTDTAVVSASRAARVEAISLMVFGLLALATTVVLVGQAVSRQVALPLGECSTLRAVGMSRSQLAGTALFSAGATALLGAGLALAVAVAASPSMPLGLARQAEIHPGIDIDPAILGGASSALAALVVLWCAGPAWRSSARPGPEEGSSAPARAATRAGDLSRLLRSPPAGIGIRFALARGAGRQAVPVVSALVAAAVAVAGLAASLTFASSLTHLVSSPTEQGWNWDVLVGNPNGFTNQEADYSARLAANPSVGSYSAVAVIAGAHQGNAYIGRVALNSFLAFDQLRGSVHPTLLAGRPPVGLHEIALGTRTLAKLHKRVGDVVQMNVGPPVGTLSLRIVGSMVAPSVGDIFTNSLGDGGWIDGPAFKAVQAEMASQSQAQGTAQPQSTFAFFAVRFAPGVSPAAGYASLRRQFGPVVLRRLPPEDVINLHSVRNLPLLLAGLVGVLGVATIGHTLFMSVSRRRRDLAVLKTIGFLRGQVGATVAWQASSFVVVALAIGLPAGIAAGRWVWYVAASGMNSSSPPVVPFLGLLLVVPGAVLAANLIASGPGWLAARVAPAVVFRKD